MGKLRVFCLVAAVAVGVLCSELLYRSTIFRDAMGRCSGHGRLIALMEGKGAYENDLAEEGFTASEFVAKENLRRAARNQPVDPVKVDRELSLLCAQFGDEKLFLLGVRSSGLSIPSLRERIVDQLRSLQWLEKQIITQTSATEKECRDSYELHRGSFAEPVRFRASHIFLAAPADTLPEVEESKQALIDSLADRLARGAHLPQLAAEASEDEATKWRDGDLGFFSSARVSSDFFAEVEKLTVGHPSKPFRSHLGFHIVKVTEVRPARLLSFDEVRGDILLAFANERRALIAKRLADMLSTAGAARSD